MIAVAIIVFREVLEAALIVSIVLAASKGTRGRVLWVTGGIALGVLGACVVAGFAAEIAQAVAGMGQELFNATILFAAVGMLGWHNVWMGRHGKEMAMEATALGREVAAGDRPLYALASVVGIAVLREGSETVLFLYGLAAAGSGGLTNLLGLLALGRLPQTKLRASYDPRFTEDRIGIWVPCTGAEAERVKEILRGHEAEEVKLHA